MVSYPWCGGSSPTDARFCIERSATLHQSATYTTRRLSDSPIPNTNTPRAAVHDAIKPGHIGIILISALLGGMLLLLDVLANRTLNSVACLLLVVGVIRFVRCTMRGKMITGLRAAAICLAFVLAMITPWMLTITGVTGALLMIMHFAEHHAVPRRQIP
jgi:hypothetical protein